MAPGLDTKRDDLVITGVLDDEPEPAWRGATPHFRWPRWIPGGIVGARPRPVNDQCRDGWRIWNAKRFPDAPLVDSPRTCSGSADRGE